MSLDLALLGQQVREMGVAVAAREGDVSRRTAQALARYLEQAGNEQQWKHAVDYSGNRATPWLYAQAIEPLDTVRPLPPVPSDYAVVAADGSQIERDRHSIADWFLINTGRVYLRYGTPSRARLASQPLLCYTDADLYITQGARRVTIEGNYLSARRDLEEMRALLELVDTHLLTEAATLPVLAIADGTLVRWALAGVEDFVEEALLHPYLAVLNQLHERSVPVVSYISRPRATEIVGVIRLMFCPDVDVPKHKGARCSECSDQKAGREPSCYVLNGLADADILAGHLREGERGPLFLSMSRVNIEKYAQHRIHFFLLRIGREVVRVELPAWVANDSALVDRCHSLIYDQAVRGQGYPVALSRAHDQAVVRAADRESCNRIVQKNLVRNGLDPSRSRKQEKKDQVAL